jgi:hypothetical protein
LKATDNTKKPAVYQVLLLDNDDTDDAAVSEAKKVNFTQVKEHLQSGGSVFITSKANQKVTLPKQHAQQNYCRSRQVSGVLFRGIER